MSGMYYLSYPLFEVKIYIHLSASNCWLDFPLKIWTVRESVLRCNKLHCNDYQRKTTKEKKPTHKTLAVLWTSLTLDLGWILRTGGAYALLYQTNQAMHTGDSRCTYLRYTKCQTLIVHLILCEKQNKRTGRIDVCKNQLMCVIQCFLDV